MSSLFERFAYRRKNDVGKVPEKENSLRRDDKTDEATTPNKAHLPAVTRVLETPDSLLPNPNLEAAAETLGSSQRRWQQRQRRRARMVSSSEDEADPPVQVEGERLTPMKTSSLFSQLPQSKRRKKYSPERVCNRGP